MENDNIILIGMPASGKSTVGVILAKIIGYQFMDSDLVIQEQEGRKLHEIITEDGIEGFLTLEEQINAKIEAEHTIYPFMARRIALDHLAEISDYYTRLKKMEAEAGIKD